MIPVLSKLLAAERIDRLGAVMSGLCAVHCALSALLPVALGALGLGVLFSHEAEQVLTLVALAFAAAALITGWRRHRSALVAALLVLGMVGLVASSVMESGEGHGHDAAPHAAAPAHDEHDHHDHGAAAPHEGEHEEGGEHGAGAAVGVVAGLLLVAGHLLGIRQARCCDEEVCA